MSTPSPGPTSSTTSSASSPASRSITPRTLRSTRKCWPSAFFGVTGLTRDRARSALVAFSSIRASSSSVGLAAHGGERRERVHHVHRLVRAVRGRAAGARYGLSVSARMRSAGTRAAASRSSARLRIRDVPGERDVVAALERRLQQVGLREAVEDDRPAERRERGRRLGARLAAVDHDRQAELLGEREVGVEQRALLAQRARRRGGRRAPSPRRRRPARCRGAPGARRSARASASPPGAGRSRARRTRPVATPRSRAPAGTSRFRSRSVTTRVTPACLARASELGRLVVARVEVRVGVDHAGGRRLVDAREERRGRLEAVDRLARP